MDDPMGQAYADYGIWVCIDCKRENWGDTNQCVCDMLKVDNDKLDSVLFDLSDRSKIISFNELKRLVNCVS